MPTLRSLPDLIRWTPERDRPYPADPVARDNITHQAELKIVLETETP